MAHGGAEAWELAAVAAARAGKSSKRKGGALPVAVVDGPKHAQIKKMFLRQPTGAVRVTAISPGARAAQVNKLERAKEQREKAKQQRLKEQRKSARRAAREERHAAKKLAAASKRGGGGGGGKKRTSKTTHLMPKRGIEMPYEDMTELLRSYRVTIRGVTTNTVLGWNDYVSFRTRRGTNALVHTGKLRNFMAASGIFASRIGQYFDPFLGYIPLPPEKKKKEKEKEKEETGASAAPALPEPLVSVDCNLNVDALLEIERFGEALIRHFGFRAFRDRKYLGAGALHTALDEREPPEFPPISNAELWTPQSWTPKAPATAENLQVLPFVICTTGELGGDVAQNLLSAALALRVYSDDRQLPNFLDILLATMASRTSTFTKLPASNRAGILHAYPFLLGYGADSRFQGLIRNLHCVKQPARWTKNAHLVHRLASFALGDFYAVMLTTEPSLQFKFVSMTSVGQEHMRMVQRVPVTTDMVLDADAYSFEAMLSVHRHSERMETQSSGGSGGGGAAASSSQSLDGAWTSTAGAVPRMRSSQKAVEEDLTDTWDYHLAEKDPHTLAMEKLAAMRVRRPQEASSGNSAAPSTSAVSSARVAQKKPGMTISDVVPWLMNVSECGCFVSSGIRGKKGETPDTVTVRSLLNLEVPAFYLQMNRIRAMAFLRNRRAPDKCCSSIALSHVTHGVLLYRLKATHGSSSSSIAIATRGLDVPVPKEILVVKADVSKAKKSWRMSTLSSTADGTKVVALQLPDRLIVWDLEDDGAVKPGPDIPAVDQRRLLTGMSFMRPAKRKPAAEREKTATPFGMVRRREPKVKVRIPAFPVPEDSAEYRAAGLHVPYDSDDEEETEKHDDAANKIADKMTLVRHLRVIDAATEVLIVAQQTYTVEVRGGGNSGRKPRTERKAEKEEEEEKEEACVHGAEAAGTAGHVATGAAAESVPSPVAAPNKGDAGETRVRVVKRRRIIWAVIPMHPDISEDAEWCVSKETDATQCEASLDGRRVVLGTSSGSVAVYKTGNGRNVFRTLAEEGRTVNGVAMHSGMVLACFDAPPKQKVCRAATFCARTGATIWEHSTDAPIFATFASPTMLGYKAPKHRT